MKINIFLLTLITTLFLGCGGNAPEELNPGELVSEADPITAGGTDDFVQGSLTITIGNDSPDDTAGYSQVGDWFQDDLLGDGDTISRYSHDPSAKVIYTSQSVGDSKYCVAVYRVTHSRNIEQAKISILDGDKNSKAILSVQNIAYNLPTSNRGWYNLGEFTFASNNQATIIIERGNGAGNLTADEVRFQRLEDHETCENRTNSATLPTIGSSGVIDNSHSTAYYEIGTWFDSTFSGYQVSTSRVTKDAAGVAVYQTNISKNKYCLSYYRITHALSSNGALFNIKNGTTQYGPFEYTFSLDPSQTGIIQLGSFNFDTASPVIVTLSNKNGAVGDLRADALLFEEGACP